MKRVILIISITITLILSLSTSGYADSASPHTFASVEGNRYLWDSESASGLLFPNGATFNQAFLPVGISLSLDDKEIELIPQSFPQKKESFWNFAFYSTSQFRNTPALLNLNEEILHFKGDRIYHVTYEREALTHESNYYQFHQLFFVERGPYQGDLLIIRSNEHVAIEDALSYYLAEDPLDPSLLQSPSDRVRVPLFNPKKALQSLLPNSTSNGQPLWGIFEPSAPRSLVTVNSLEAQLDTNFPLILRYANFTDSPNQLQADLQNARSENRMVELTLQTNEDNGLESSIYSVLNGTYDRELRDLARVVRQQGDPVLFRLNNEMNGDWCNYSALYFGMETQLYKDTWNWIYQIFQEEGADNARWIFNPNERSFPQYRWNHMLAYLPALDQIDAVGLTGYNTGNFYPGERWRSFAEIFDPIYKEYDKVFAYPLLITEFSSSSIGGNKETWIKEMFDQLPYYPRIEALIWWDYADYATGGKIARPYYIDETPDVMDAFREGFKSFYATE
ncbi:glycosyl hydrolase [Gottschalkiaceae bacterium SANA]|nr:glycosyl hydrolase [Gottschalkiaceae bacterium SANA]